MKKLLLLLFVMVSLCPAARGQSWFNRNIAKPFTNHVVGQDSLMRRHDPPPIEYDDPEPWHIGIAGAYNGSRILSDCEIFGGAAAIWKGKPVEIKVGLNYRSYNVRIHWLGMQETRSFGFFAEGNIYPFRRPFYVGLRVDLGVMGGVVGDGFHDYVDEHGYEWARMLGSFWLFATAGWTAPLSRKFSVDVFVQPGCYTNGLRSALKDAGIPLTADRFGFVLRGGLSVRFWGNTKKMSGKPPFIP